jgi:hypothetical protein
MCSTEVSIRVGRRAVFGAFVLVLVLVLVLDQGLG